MCVWVETDTATPGMDDLCVNMISQPKMTEIPVKTVPLEGGGGHTDQGPRLGMGPLVAWMVHSWFVRQTVYCTI